MESVLSAIWFFLPAAFANMAPIFANNIPQIAHWKPPMDFGRSYRGHRIFGDHKTFRGLAAGAIMGMLITALQMWLTRFSWNDGLIQYVDYTNVEALFAGGFLGVGALVGDAVKSFFKRQVGIKPGKSWVPFDQTDWIFGAYLFGLPFAVLDLPTYLWSLIIAACLHPITNLLGWVLKMKDKPF